MLTSLIQAREKRRQVPLAALPTRMVEAVLAIEDRRYYLHPGVDPIRIVGALFRNTFATPPVSRGRQHHHAAAGAKLLPHRRDEHRAADATASVRRKLLEQFMAIILDIRATRTRCSSCISTTSISATADRSPSTAWPKRRGCTFGKDVNNLSLGEAATIAGIIQSPGTLSPFASPDRARERRNVVLSAMVDAGYVAQDAADRASKEPLAPVARALDAEAPYFVDFVGQTLAEQFPAVTQTTTAVDVYTTLDLHLQRLAQDAVSDGLAKVDQLLSRRKRGAGAAGGAHRRRPAYRRYSGDGRRPVVQPVAVQPRRERQPSAGLDLQAVRLSVGVRARRGGRHLH